MTRVLLPIKPRFVEQIFAGTKQYEFRKQIFKDKTVKTILIYASYPVKKVIGQADIAEVIYTDIDSLYELRKTCPDPQESFFFKKQFGQTSS